MALLKDLNGSLTDFATDATTFTNCYCVVCEPVSIGKQQTTVQLEWWLDEATRNEGGKRPLAMTYHVAPGTETPEFADEVAAASGSLLTALYNWLKKQPELSGAVDA